MASAIQPKTINAKHRQVILMTAMGYSQVEISQELGFSQPYISTILSSPKHRELLFKLQKDIEGEALDSHVGNLEKYLSPAIERVGDLIDNGTSEDGVKLSAANSVIDRFIPKIHRQEIDETRRIIIDGADMTTLAKVIAEVEGKTLEVSDFKTLTDDLPLRAKMPEEVD